MFVQIVCTSAKKNYIFADHFSKFPQYFESPKHFGLKSVLSLIAAAAALSIISSYYYTSLMSVQGL